MLGEEARVLMMYLCGWSLNLIIGWYGMAFIEYVIHFGNIWRGLYDNKGSNSAA